MTQPCMRMRRPDGKTVKVGSNTHRRSDTRTPQFPYYNAGYNNNGVVLLPGYYEEDFDSLDFIEWTTSDVFCPTDVEPEFRGDPNSQPAGYDQGGTSYQEPAAQSWNMQSADPNPGDQSGGYPQYQPATPEPQYQPEPPQYHAPASDSNYGGGSYDSSGSAGGSYGE